MQLRGENRKRLLRVLAGVVDLSKDGSEVLLEEDHYSRFKRKMSPSSWMKTFPGHPYPERSDLLAYLEVKAVSKDLKKLVRLRVADKFLKERKSLSEYPRMQSNHQQQEKQLQQESDNSAANPKGTEEEVGQGKKPILKRKRALESIENRLDPVFPDETQKLLSEIRELQAEVELVRQENKRLEREVSAEEKLGMEFRQAYDKLLNSRSSSNREAENELEHVKNRCQSLEEQLDTAVLLEQIARYRGFIDGVYFRESHRAVELPRKLIEVRHAMQKLEEKLIPDALRLVKERVANQQQNSNMST